MYMLTPATEASMMAVGHFSKTFDPGKNGLQLTDDSVTRLKNEFAASHPNIFFSYIPFQNDDTERLVETFARNALVMKRERERQGSSLLTRHTQGWSEREVDPMLCCAKEILLSSVIVL